MPIKCKHLKIWKQFFQFPDMLLAVYSYNDRFRYKFVTLAGKNVRGEKAGIDCAYPVVVKSITDNQNKRLIFMSTLAEIQVNVQPLADRVLVEPAPAEEKTAFGIIIPDTAKASHNAEPELPLAQVKKISLLQ